jgi:ribulose-5-phosphate 4-epimerase/fuculose-1-phosphate aldolase
VSKYDDHKRQVLEYSQSLARKGYLVGTGGNLSVRIEGEEALAVTPSNFDYLAMSPQDICIVSWDQQPIEGERKPSVETGLHTAVYQNRPDVNAVIHTHQQYASVFALINQPIPALYDEQVRFLGRSVEIVPYGPSGTGLLKRQVASKLQNHCNAYILQNHGALCLGITAERAAFNVELLEKCALTYLLALCTEKKVFRIPLAVREIAFAQLRRDQKKAEARTS